MLEGRVGVKEGHSPLVLLRDDELLQMGRGEWALVILSDGITKDAKIDAGLLEDLEGYIAHQGSIIVPPEDWEKNPPPGLTHGGAGEEILGGKEGDGNGVEGEGTSVRVG